MPIDVVCPHCESRLKLQEELLGRSMRCPICHDVFTVALADEPVNVAVADVPIAPAREEAVVRSDEKPSNYRSGSIEDFLPVLKAEPLAPPTDAKVVRFSDGEEPVETKEPPPPPPRETKWSELNEAPSPSTQARPKVEQPTQPRKKRGRKTILAILILVVIGGAGIGGYFLKKYSEAAPQRLYEKATKEYQAKHYEPARKLFDELAKEYPDHPHAAEARFFAELSSVRGAVYSVSVRSDPEPANQQLRRFLSSIEDPNLKPFAAPKKFAVDILETVLKLTEDVVNKGNDIFNRDKPEAAVVWVDLAADLGTIADRFRPTDQGRESVYKQIDTLRQRIADARTRLEFLASAKTKLSDPDDERIMAVRKEAEASGIAADPAFTQIIGEAEQQIVRRVIYRRFNPLIAPTPEMNPSPRVWHFAPRLDKSALQEPRAGAATVFFALAGGCLYALDEVDGHILWVAHVGIDANSLPLIIPSTELHPELAIVVANDGIRCSLLALHARTGEPFWRQSLPSACFGRPVQVGQRLYVALRDRPIAKDEPARKDELGVVLEVDLTNGYQVGKIALGRSLGGSGTRLPGTGRLFFAAESRGIYVFDVDRTGPDGFRLEPAFLGILPTEHSAGSLRGEPIVTAAEGDAASFLILGIADGLHAMKLHSYRLAALDQPVGFVGASPEPITLSGWTWFAPYCDSEKLALVTDRGEFGLFGINQAGNLDAPVFLFPPTPVKVLAVNAPSRGQIVHADEGTFWFIANSSLRQARLGFDAKGGLKLVARDNPLSIGEPLQAAQVNQRGDTAVVVTRIQPSAACRATAIDLRTGTIRWQRQLGLIARGEPQRLGDAIIMLDQGGGLYRFDAKSESGLDSLLQPPFANLLGSPYLITGPDRESLVELATVQAEKGLRLHVRQLKAAGKLQEQQTDIPAPIAGNPIVVGRSLILPLANGFLHRLMLEGRKPLETGPSWRGERVSPQATAHLNALDDAEFLVSDGARTLNRWRWANNEDEFSRKGLLTLSERIGAPPLLAPNGKSRLFVADVKGNLTLWDIDRLSPDVQPVQAWRAMDDGVLTSGPKQLSDGQVVYVQGGNCIKRLAYSEEKKEWIANPTIRVDGKGVVGHPQLFGQRLFVSDRGGKIFVFDAESGKAIGEPIKSEDSTPAAAAMPIDASRLLIPLEDGTLFPLTNETK